MTSQVSSSRKIVKNTAFMYIRMLVLMIISLYTSRVVLEILGISDFGIYSLVGSIIAMFASVRTIFSASTQRFLNYEMGKGNIKCLSDIFSTSVYINIVIAIIFIFLVELLGIWFFSTSVNIDPERLYAAKCVFHLSLFTSVFGLLTTSYDALIISFEKMNYYAYLSILEACLKLLVVYLLLIIDYDKLIVYGVLTLFVSILVFFFNILYCNYSFKDCKFNGVLNRSYLKQLTTFAGWNFFGVSAYTLTQNGLNMILNIFGGTVINAARGITYQVVGILNNFVGNIAIVINPHGTKLYASGNLESFVKLFKFSSKSLFFLQLCLVFFFLLFSDELLSLWLIEVPPFTLLFLKLVLLNTLLRSLHSPLDLLFKASANLKYYQLIEGLILAMPLLFSYYFLDIGMPCYVVFVLVIIFEFINLIALVILARRIIDFSIFQYVVLILFPCMIMFSISAASYMYISEQGIIEKFLGYLITVVIMICAYYITLSKSEREYIFKLLNKGKS